MSAITTFPLDTESVYLRVASNDNLENIKIDNEIFPVWSLVQFVVDIGIADC